MARLFAGDRTSLLEEFAKGVTDEQLRDLPALKALMEERKDMRDHISVMHTFLDGIDWESVGRCVDAGVNLRRIMGMGMAVLRYRGYYNVMASMAMPYVLFRVKDE